MKQLLIILFLILLCSQQTFTQVSKKLESFRKEVLPEYSMYFNQAELTEYGQLNLSAVDKYNELSADGKKEIMANINTAWRDSLFFVHYGSQIELWGLSVETGIVQLLDGWDLNSPQLVIVPKIVPQPHPWFFYVGGQLGFDNYMKGNYNYSFNTRLGFFLLSNRWDFAATFSKGATDNLDIESSTMQWSNFGLMSRVHFPIKEYSISPNIGAEITLASFGKTPSTVSGSLVFGVSWFVGIGCLDFGIKIGNITTSMIGYTMFP